LDLDDNLQVLVAQVSLNRSGCFPQIKRTQMNSDSPVELICGYLRSTQSAEICGKFISTKTSGLLGK